MDVYPSEVVFRCLQHFLVSLTFCIIEVCTVPGAVYPKLLYELATKILKKTALIKGVILIATATFMASVYFKRVAKNQR